MARSDQAGRQVWTHQVRLYPLDGSPPVNAYATQDGNRLRGVGCSVTAPGQTLATRGDPRAAWEGTVSWASHRIQALAHHTEPNRAAPHRVVVYVLIPESGHVEPHAALSRGCAKFSVSWASLLAVGVLEPAGGRRRKR